MKKTGSLLLLASCCKSSFAFRLQNVPRSGNRISQPAVHRYMQPSSKESDDITGRSRRLGQVDTSYKTSSSDKKRVPRTELLAATLDSVENNVDNSVDSFLGRFEIPTSTLGPSTVEAATKVLSASLLITGNTVGSSMFVLPEAVGGVGLMNGSALFIGEKMIAHPFIMCVGKVTTCAHFYITSCQ